MLLCLLMLHPPCLQSLQHPQATTAHTQMMVADLHHAATIQAAHW